MRSPLVDTHCHLDEPLLAESFDAVLERARAAGVVQCVTIGTSVASSRRSVELARQDPMLRAAGGPHHGLVHCASGPPTFIREALALGLHISFAGNVTFPNAGALRELVPLVPEDRLLLETDAPFLAPQPVRGQPNEPAHVAHTAAAVASLRGVSVEALAALTTANARRLFGLPA